jgi:hypothetical protein
MRAMHSLRAQATFSITDGCGQTGTDESQILWLNRSVQSPQFDPIDAQDLALAVHARRVAARDAEIDEEEIAVAVRACALDPGGVPEMLATDARREAVRLRLGRIAALGTRSLPMLSRDLRAALRQSAASDPKDDPVWGAVCVDVARGYAAPERN